MRMTSRIPFIHCFHSITKVSHTHTQKKNTEKGTLDTTEDTKLKMFKKYNLCENNRIPFLTDEEK